MKVAPVSNPLNGSTFCKMLLERLCALLPVQMLETVPSPLASSTMESPLHSPRGLHDPRCAYDRHVTPCIDNWTTVETGCNRPASYTAAGPALLKPSLVCLKRLLRTLSDNFFHGLSGFVVFDTHAACRFVVKESETSHANILIARIGSRDTLQRGHKCEEASRHAELSRRL
jgi:hypothetical protein